MPSCSGFNSSVSMTFIGTATAILEIDGVKFLTDPFFSPAKTDFVHETAGYRLFNHHDPALTLSELPPIDAILLSHEDHWDNLDDLGRRLLDGRHVFTTMDGAKQLAPRPGVVGMRPWQENTIVLGGKTFHITATPAVHTPGGECTGFILTTESFGRHPDGRPNAIYFTGDTVYTDELPPMAENFHIAAAIMNIGDAHYQFEPEPAPMTQITMGGKDAARLFRAIKADWIVPMHYDGWDHFTQYQAELSKAFKETGVHENVIWLKPGESVKIF
ncbi:beta-lactamase superfamily domain-containing protein [Plectosphaerella cucumerina]|uniref:Beta-lactamase superfamily domain-containing protein n=1 Tax=Plectosphaerella cucumerina TaxID=40658 RepID=A0A8K0T4C4_9PEZI|nr:beta-lactamase superfamily domain-containing protein [Plectosphaerella cucumerina]